MKPMSSTLYNIATHAPLAEIEAELALRKPEDYSYKLAVKNIYRARLNSDSKVYRAIYYFYLPILRDTTVDKLNGIKPVWKSRFNDELEETPLKQLQKAFQEDRWTDVMDLIREGKRIDHIDVKWAAAAAIMHLCNKSGSAALIGRILSKVPQPNLVALRTLPDAIRNNRRGLIGNYLTSKLITVDDIAREWILMKR